MRNFIINNRTYRAREIDFNTICEMEEYGINLNDLGAIRKKSMTLTRAYFAVCSGLSLEEAGKEVETHVIGGGDLNDLNEAFAEMFGKSDFFLAIIERAKENMEQSEEQEQPKKRTTKKIAE